MSRNFDIAIAGEINLDLILSGLPEQMPCDRELLADGFACTLGSSSAILAHNLSILGASVTFASLIGADALGEIAVDCLSKASVDLSVRRTEDCTTGVTLLLPHGNRRHMFTYLGTIAQMKLSHLDLEHLATARHFHLSSLFLQTALRPDVPELFRRMRQKGLTISLDTNDDPEDRWEGVLDTVLPLVDIFLPNDDEACRMTKTQTAEEAIQALGEIVPLVVMKCGARGALIRRNGITETSEPVQVKPIDTIGAGDSFNAGFLYGYVNGLSPVAAARCGNICGALSTQRPGGVEAFRDEALRNAFFEQNPLPIADESR